MKKALLFIIIPLLFILTSCTNSVYKKFSSIENSDQLKENVFVEVTAKKFSSELQKEIDNPTTEDKYIYLFYANPSDSTAQTAILNINAQAKQYNINKVYFVNSSKYQSTLKKRNEAKNYLKINDSTFESNFVAYKISSSTKTLDDLTPFADFSLSSTRNNYKTSDSTSDSPSYLWQKYLQDIFLTHSIK